MASNDFSEPYYFNSLYRHGVDDKRRVQIPAKWPPSHPDARLSLFLWPEGGIKEDCLLVLPQAGVDELVKKLNSLPSDDPNKPILRRFLGENSDSVTLDKAGRMCLPEAMVNAVAITSEVILNGMFDRFQIWNPERYEISRPRVEAMAPEAIKLIN